MVWRRAFVVHHEYQDERNDVEPCGDEERVPKPDELCDSAADDRADGGPETLGGLDEPDRIGNAVARRGVGGHRQRQRPIAGEEPLRGTKREYLPGVRDEGHRAHQEDEADERSLHHDLPSVTVREAAPEGRQQRGERRRDAKTQPRPHRNRADVGDTELLEVQREKRHHQRKAGEADEARGGDGEEISSPVQGRTPTACGSALAVPAGSRVIRPPGARSASADPGDNPRT